MNEPRRRGRPREFDEVVSIRMPRALHDALSIEAVRHGQELSTVIRDGLDYFVSQKSRLERQQIP